MESRSMPLRSCSWQKRLVRIDLHEKGKEVLVSADVGAIYCAACKLRGIMASLCN